MSDSVNTFKEFLDTPEGEKLLEEYAFLNDIESDAEEYCKIARSMLKSHNIGFNELMEEFNNK